MDSWPPIARSDLLTGNANSFGASLPTLVRRLVLETCPDVTEIDMPSDEGTAMGGFDGVVMASRGDAFVPEGLSVWEVSVEQDPGKADRDYDKDLEAPHGAVSQSVAYVQLLLGPWRDRRDWSRERTALGRWREVRGYGVDRVMTWLEQAPATTCWLADRLGKRLPGIMPMETWWRQVWLASTSPELDSRLVLAGREDQAERLRAVLDARQPVVRVGGDLRPDELCAFVAASTCEDQGHAGTGALGVRMLRVTDVESLRTLCRLPQPLVLVLPDAGLARDLLAHAHQLVVPVRYGEHADVEVGPVDSLAMRELLIERGVAPERAGELGALGRRSLSALRRALAVHPERLRPDWAEPAPGPMVRRLLLLGGWSAGSEGDTQAVVDLTGRASAEVEEAVGRLMSTDVPFLGEHGSTRYLLAPADAWQLLGHSLSREDLDRLTRVCTQVLTFEDPLERTPERQQSATFWRGNAPRYSWWLRHCLARTLALLASGTLGDRLVGGRDGTTWALLVVRDILQWASDSEDLTRWSGLGDVLGLLAEAAPREFTDSLQRNLDDHPELMGASFFDAALGSPFVAASVQTQVLVALERIAWSPDYLDDVVDVLVDLCKIDPGGRQASRPFASLTAILSAWGPNTSADAPSRARLLRQVARSSPDLGSRLALALIPSGSQGHVESGGPLFRDWKQARILNTVTDMHIVTEAALDVALRVPVSKSAHWKQVVSQVGELPPPRRAMVAARLAQLSETSSEQERHEVYLALRELVARHREYADTDWAMPRADVELFEQVRDQMAPRDLTLKHEFLFDESATLLGELHLRDDHRAHQQELDNRRASAVAEIRRVGGAEAVAQFARRVAQPRLVGDALAASPDVPDEELLSWLDRGDRVLADTALDALDLRVRRNGSGLRDDLLHKADTATTKGLVLTLGGASPDAWSRLRELPPEAAEAYWKTIDPRDLIDAGDPEGFRALTRGGRPAATLGMIHLGRLDSAEFARVAAEAMELLLTSPRGVPHRRQPFQGIIDLLSRRADQIDPIRVANIEAAVLPDLPPHGRIPTLQKILFDDPSQYASLVEQVYRPDGEDHSTEGNGPGPAEGEELRRQESAMRAFRILRALDMIPGQRPDGVVEAEVLTRWVRQARECLAASGRKRSGDSQIGELLAKAPDAEDGGIIPTAVRDVLEDARSRPLEGGLRVGLFNRRGVTQRGLYDGGGQERELVDRFGAAADVCRPWPRAARVLRDLQDSYRHDGHWQDAQAESLRLGLHG